MAQSMADAMQLIPLPSKESISFLNLDYYCSFFFFPFVSFFSLLFFCFVFLFFFFLTFEYRYAYDSVEYKLNQVVEFYQGFVEIMEKITEIAEKQEKCVPLSFKEIPEKEYVGNQ